MYERDRYNSGNDNGKDSIRGKQARFVIYYTGILPIKYTKWIRTYIRLTYIKRTKYIY